MIAEPFWSGSGHCIRTFAPLFDVVGDVTCVKGLVLAGIMIVSDHNPKPHLFLALSLNL